MIFNNENERHWIEPGLDMVSKLPILHFYGSLGDLRDVPYGDTACKIDDMARRIRVIGEERGEQDENVLKARDWIGEAERVVFLGFGFDAVNMRLLGFDAELFGSVTTERGKFQQLLFATTYGLERAERVRVLNRWFSRFANSVHTISSEHIDKPITKYLREFGALFFD